MNKKDFINKIWNYYLMIEEDFVETLKYVEPCEDNYKTYSKKYNSLLLSICSEIDVICKVLCKNIDSSLSYNNITAYRKLLKNYNNFPNQSCTFNRMDKKIIPWLTWNNDKNPQWWKDYNKLKHNRLADDNDTKGNFFNVLCSLAAYYILCMILYREFFKYEPKKKSLIFEMTNWPDFLIYDDDNAYIWNEPELPDEFYGSVE